MSERWRSQAYFPLVKRNPADTICWKRQKRKEKLKKKQTAAAFFRWWVTDFFFFFFFFLTARKFPSFHEVFFLFLEDHFIRTAHGMKVRKVWCLHLVCQKGLLLWTLAVRTRTWRRFIKVLHFCRRKQASREEASPDTSKFSRIFRLHCPHSTTILSIDCTCQARHILPAWRDEWMWPCLCHCCSASG